MRSEAVAKAIKAAGGVSRLAAICGISPQAVQQWKRIPSERAIQINQALAIPLEQLRPDLCNPQHATTRGVAA